MVVFLKIKEIFERCHNMRSFSRNPSFELLRLYSIFLILMRHLKAHSYPVNQTDPSYKMIKFLYSLTVVCNNEFMLISGYFTCLSNIKISRFIPLILQNLSYSISGYVYALSIKLLKFDRYLLIKVLFPISRDIFWYTGPFIISQIFFSTIFRGLYQLGKKYHILLIILTAYSATLGCAKYGHTIAVWGIGTNINTFIYFLLLGSYLRFYEIKLNAFLSFIGIIIFSLLHYFGVSKF